MGVPVLIIGKSGTGKSASLRNFKKADIGIINVLGKPLPFKNDFQYIVTDNYPKVKNALLQAKVDTLVIDDAGYLITSEFMRRAKEKGYEKFTELANNFYELISYIQHELPEERIVYLVMHEDENDMGIVKPKTIGKLLDEKVCVEGMFTIVLRSMKNENKYVFRTQSNGFDIAKTPMKLFDSDEIENDLKFVTEKIKEYYNIGNKEAEVNEKN
jgi:hypothetical protein